MSNQTERHFAEADMTTWSGADYLRVLFAVKPLFLAANNMPGSARTDSLVILPKAGGKNTRPLFSEASRGATSRSR